MLSFQDPVVVAVIALITGAVLGILSGVLLNRFFSTRQKKTRSLEARLRQTEVHLTEYQQQVTDHFAETARLVNNLTRSYRDMHEHLAGDALKLANVDISRQLLTRADGGDRQPGETMASEENFQPPRDWAPKVLGGADTLGEGFDIDDDPGQEERPDSDDYAGAVNEPSTSGRPKPG